MSRTLQSLLLVFGLIPFIYSCQSVSVPVKGSTMGSVILPLDVTVNFSPLNMRQNGISIPIAFAFDSLGNPTEVGGVGGFEKKRNSILEIQESKYLHWGELLSSDGRKFNVTAGNSFRFLKTALFGDRLPLKIKYDPDLKHLVMSRYMKSPKVYLWGALDKIGDSLVYVASRKKVPTYSKLYRVMVRVLSKEYGCLMRKRVLENQKMFTHCADGRQVVFTRTHGTNWIQFVSYQLDRRGNRISVVNHKIVGSSSTH